MTRICPVPDEFVLTPRAYQLRKDTDSTTEANAFTRAIFIVQLYYYREFQLSEAATHHMNHFIIDKTQDEELWFMKIRGKGNQSRLMPPPPLDREDGAHPAHGRVRQLLTG